MEALLGAVTQIKGVRRLISGSQSQYFVIKLLSGGRAREVSVQGAVP